jgi:hypothetical protein
MPLSTKHTREGDNPQTYFEHFRVAFVSSVKLMWYGVAGIIHAFIPGLLPFYTSTGIIKIYRQLVESGRHDDEIQEIFDLEDEVLEVTFDFDLDSLPSAKSGMLH